jgi:hypothetical protein
LLSACEIQIWATTAIREIFGGDKPAHQTFADWIRKIDDKKTFNLSTFLKGNSKDKYSGFSGEAISALIAFEHVERRTEIEATKRLNRLFSDDKKITLEFVEVSILFLLLTLI